MMHIIIVGGDEMVYFLARQLQDKGNHITIINKSQLRCNQLFQQTRATVVHGDGTSLASLEGAGARMADVLLALTPYDQDNLISCQIAQKVFGVPHTIALVNDPDNEEVFHKLGVTQAFSSTRIIASMIEQQAGFDAVTQLMPIGEGHIHVAEVSLNDDAPAVGKSLMDLHISSETLVACIIRGDDVIIPRGADRLQPGDHLLIISKPGYEEKDLKLILGDGG